MNRSLVGVLALSLACPACSLEGIATAVADVALAPLDALTHSPDQQQAEVVLSRPTRDWSDALPTEHVPTDDETGLVLVYLAGLETMNATAIVPELFIAASLTPRVQALTANYPSVFGGGNVKITGIDPLSRLGARGTCEDSCSALPGFMSSGEPTQSCLTSDSLKRLVSAWQKIDLDAVWRAFEEAYAATPDNADAAIAAATAGKADELSLTFAKAIVKGVDDLTVASSVAQVFAVQSAFQCSSTTNQLTDDFLACTEWKAENACGE